LPIVFIAIRLIISEPMNFGDHVLHMAANFDNG